jgi:hypothetical protein
MVTNRFNSTTEVPKGPSSTDAKGEGRSPVDRKAEEVIKRFERLQSNRTNWEQLWQEVLKYVVPRKAWVTRKRETAGERTDSNIFDTTARRANQILAAGFHGNMTNPATKWFNLRLQDPGLNAIQDVKEWLADSENKILDVLNGSNFNEQIHESYVDLGSVGTSVLLAEEDSRDIVRFRAVFIEEIVIDENDKERVDTVYRKFRMSAKAAWDLWGERAGPKTKEAMKDDKWDEKITFIHCVMPRDRRDPFSNRSTEMPFESTHVEVDSRTTIGEGGFHEQPYMVTRFNKVAGDMYGYSPGVILLPDIKMLNAMAKTLIKAAQKIVDPPLVMPHDGFLLPLKTVPGGINYKLTGNTTDKIEPLETKGNIPIGRDMINDYRLAINNGYFTDLFLLLADRKNMTATEVQERIAEKMVMLGPVIGRLQSEMLDPIIGRVFGILLRQGVLAPPPPALEGRELIIEYVSPLALAQRREAITSVSSLLQLAGGVAQFIPEVIDKIDGDKVIDEAAEIFGVSPQIIRDAEGAGAIREQRAQVQQEQAQLELAQQAIDADKTSSEAERNRAEAKQEEGEE